MSEQLDSLQALAELRACRNELEKLDCEIVELIAQRLMIARLTTGLKRAANLSITDSDREAVVIDNAVSKARKLGVEEEPVREIFERIVMLSRRVQESAE